MIEKFKKKKNPFLKKKKKDNKKLTKIDIMNNHKLIGLILNNISKKNTYQKTNP